VPKSLAVVAGLLGHVDLALQCGSGHVDFAFACAFGGVIISSINLGKRPSILSIFHSKNINIL